MFFYIFECDSKPICNNYSFKTPLNMKKVFFTLALLITTGIAFAQTDATDFTADDCEGNTHHLFADLDAGKVVVMAWVMPCGGCVNAAKTAYNLAQSAEANNPGRVVFYLCDDYANTGCSTISGWASNNNMTKAVTFSNSSISMTDYGSAGMPKIVVLGGSAHTIFDNENYSVNSTTMQNAINQALLATGITENIKADLQLNVFPNPANNETYLNYNLSKASDISIDIYNLLGAKIKTIVSERQSAGNHKTEINLENLRSGVYFVKLNTIEGSQVTKITISK